MSSTALPELVPVLRVSERTWKRRDAERALLSFYTIFQKILNPQI